MRHPSSGAFLSLKFVAQAAHDYQVDRVRRVILNLPSQRQDMKFHRAGIKGVIVAPHLLQELISTEHLSSVPHQKEKQLELHGGQLKNSFITKNTVATNVNGKIGNPYWLGDGLLF